MIEPLIPADYVPSVEFCMKQAGDEGQQCSQKYPCGGAFGQDHPAMQNSTGGPIAHDSKVMNKEQMQMPSEQMQMPSEKKQMSSGQQMQKDGKMEINSEDQSQQPKLGESTQQNKVPSPIQQETSPRPTLLDGIQIEKNQSDAVSTNEVRPNRPTKFRRNVS
jgi:hypothetical protein